MQLEDVDKKFWGACKNQFSVAQAAAADPLLSHLFSPQDVNDSVCCEARGAGWVFVSGRISGVSLVGGECGRFCCDVFG